MFLVFTGLLAGGAGATDLAMERRWQEAVIDQVVVGNVHWLDADGYRFYSIYTEADSSPKGAVIIMHGMRRHPDWPDVIAPLRTALAKQGWATLSLQMPVLGFDTGMRDHSVLLNESPARIWAAIGFLKKRDHKKIVLIGHGLGAIMGASYLVENGKKDIAGLAAIGMYMLNYTDPRMWTPDLLVKLRLPILDIYGQMDQYGVEHDKEVRAQAAARANNRRYRQVMISQADHDFTGHGDELVDHIKRWLEEL
ncbi:MAG: hypothetical protein A2V90_08105 [Gammaproteobacteria bacterium RBG_16_57_12]|nr:MAG: hypothetical protein A2V90_08105 [Gammaproteobacteria bacterium RBG_16_57_12]